MYCSFFLVALVVLFSQHYLLRFISVLSCCVSADAVAVTLLMLGCQESIDQAVYLDLKTSVDLGKLKTSEGCITHSKIADSVTALEELVMGWCQQIEKV